MRNWVRKYYLIFKWHRTKKRHPVFDPKYAQENLLSLFGFLFMTLLYLVSTILFLHLLVLGGVVETETILWLMIESGTRIILVGFPEQMIAGTLFSGLSFTSSLILIFFARLIIGLYQAKLHPESEKEIANFITSKRQIKI
ncbi:MAG: hypothetical protein PHW75_00565 [Patescibacteria group bacterium]|nr:hypothetical protein [Patescibacteria group bacterium]